ncbi:LEPR-XLL domain-containing protein, partial [Desulfosarcina sp. OttesenSCG-928-G10]|nr:LEPR-XLL domain-containing protein [Desulfosarcina sp. OttesenSCG-928-G10]
MKRVLFKTADPRPEKNTADDSIQKDALALSRKRMVFEAIEPRILLSADLHPAADALNPELAGSNGSEAAEVFSLASTETPLVLMSDAVNGASYAVNGALFNESTATIIEAGEEITLTGTLDSELVVRGKVTLSRATTTHAIILDGGTLYLDQSTVSNTTISQTENGGTATANGGSLNAVTLNTDLTAIANVFVVTGGLELNATLTLSNRLQCSGTQTITGSGQIVLQGSADLQIAGSYSTPAMVTLDTGITVRAGTASDSIIYNSNGSLINRGTIVADAGTGTFSITLASLTNEGAICAGNGKNISIATLTNAAGATVTVTGGSTLTLNNVTNAGTISATDATVNFGGSVRLEDLGIFNRVNSVVYLTGTLDNTDSTLFVDTAFNGGFGLGSGGVIKGGIVDAVANDYVMNAIGGTLNNVTLETDLIVSNSGNYPLYVTNGLVLNSTLTIGGSSSLQCSGTQTISGSGQVVFGNSANLYIYGTSSAAAVLTVDTGITLRVTGNSGSVSRYYGSLINRGAIIAEAGSYTFTITVDALTNEGVISAINGKSLTLNTLTNTAGRTVSITGGGTLTLTSGTNAGTILAEGGALTVGTMQNTGTISANSAILSINGGWPNNGVVSATDSTVNFGGSFKLEDIGTFSRTNSTVYLTGTLDNTDATLLADTAFNGGFILVSGGVIKGGIVDAVADDYVMSAAGGMLNNVTLEADLTVSSGT